jgi:2-phosphoglycerate kinase
LTHHISTGFLRAAIDGFLPQSQSRLLRRHAFTAYEELEGPRDATPQRILEGCIAQAEILKPIFKACIARARREGIGLVMEGSHFIPGVIDPAEYGADLMCVLDVPDRQELKKRALSPNHPYRRLSAFDLERLEMLQEQLLMMAGKHKGPVVVNIDLVEAVREVRGLVGGLTAAR